MSRWKMKWIWLGERYLDLFDWAWCKTRRFAYRSDHLMIRRRTLWFRWFAEFFVCVLATIGPLETWLKRRNIQNRTTRIGAPGKRMTVRTYPLTWLNRIKYKDIDKTAGVLLDLALNRPDTALQGPKYSV